jgi:hypothetical protein
MVPIALDKRIFDNFKVFNVITFPSKADFLLLKYTISSRQTHIFPLSSAACPRQNGTFPDPKYYRSSTQVQRVPRQK